MAAPILKIFKRHKTMRRMRRRNAISPNSFEAELLSIFSAQSRNSQVRLTHALSNSIESPSQFKLKDLFQIECPQNPRAAPAA